MVRPLLPLAATAAAALLLLLLVLVCGPHPAAALTAALWNADSTGTCYSSPIGSLTNLANGGCYKVGQYGARVQCADDGTVTQAALYSDYSCGIVAFSGSGVGDGVSCIRMSSRNYPNTYFSAIIDCSAPGPKPALSSSAKSGIIAGSVIAGVLLLVGGGWWCYRRQQSENAGTLQHSMSMQKPSPATHYIPSHSTGGAAGIVPGTAMAVVCCCLALLFPGVLLAPVAGQTIDDCPCILKADCQGGQFVPFPSSPPSGWKCFSGYSTKTCPGNLQSDCHFNGVPNYFGNPQVGCCYPPDRCYLFAPTNGAMGNCSATIPAGDSCSFSCNPGYVLDQPSTTCNEGLPSKQRCVPPSCHVPNNTLTLPSNAIDMGSCSVLDGPTGRLNPGASCSFRCAEGYSSWDVSCSASGGVLSGLETACQESSCLPQAPLHGAVEYDSSCRYPTAPGSSCRLSCDAGRSLTPPGPTTCRFGKFEPSNQICGVPCSLHLLPAIRNGSLQLGQCPPVLSSGLSCQMGCPEDASGLLVGATASCYDGAMAVQPCRPTSSGSPTATGNSTGADSIAAASVSGAGAGLFLLLGWAWLVLLGEARRSSCV